MIAEGNTQVKEFLENAKVKRDEAVAVLTKADVGSEEFEAAEKQLNDINKRAEQIQKIHDLNTQLEKFQPEDGKDDAEPVGTAEKFTNMANEKQMLLKHWTDQGLQKDDGFPHAGHFFSAVANFYKTNHMDERLQRFDDATGLIVNKDVSSLVGADGGFLINPERQRGLHALMGELSIVLPRANVMPMMSRTLDITRVDQEGTAANRFHWYGGLIGYWIGEAQKIIESNPQFRRTTLTAHKLAAGVGVPNEVLADVNQGIALETYLSGPLGFPGALASYMDHAFLMGDGTMKPLGVIPSAATITVAKAATTTVTYADIAKFLSATLPGQNYVWIIHVGMRGQFMELQGASQTDILLWGDPVNGIPERLIGYPVIWSEKVPATGNKGSMGLYDLRHYLVGNRQMVSVDVDMSFKFMEDMTMFRAIGRVDGKPMQNAPITLFDGSTEVSPFVASSN